jgi:hypothetical protein
VSWRHLRTGTFLDIVISLVLIVIGIVTSTQYLSTRKAQGDFYQEEFGPAVMVACGRGYQAPVFNPTTESLKQFLQQNSPSFDCSDLPHDIQVKELNGFQAVHAYLYRAVATVWQLSEISWAALDKLKVVLFSATIGIAYFLFRLGSGRLFSFLGALLVSCSALYLSYLPHLRDFAKAPFMLASLLAIAVLVTTESRLAKRISALAAGAILGLGLGFRMDLMLIMPFALLAIALFAYKEFDTGSILERTKAIGLFLAGWLAIGFPILFAVKDGGSNTFHVILLGLSTSFDHALGIQFSFYEWLETYNDIFLYNILNAHWDQTQSTGFLVELATRDYEQAAFSYWWSIFSHFPADFFLRFIAAIWRTLELAFTTPFLTQFNTTEVSFLYPRQYLEYISYVALIPPALVILYLLYKSPRLGLFLLVSIIYFTGLTFLQYGERHYFYLLIIPLWLALVGANKFTRLIGATARQLNRLPQIFVKGHSSRFIRSLTPSKPKLLHAAILSTAILFAASCTWFVSRWVQHQQ